MATSYNALLARCQREAVIPVTDARFTAEFPSIVVDAELRILRELDPQFARKRRTTTFSASNALLGVEPAAIVVRTIDYFIGNKRVPLDEREESWVNDYWPDRTLTGTPKYWALLNLGSNNAWQVLVAPTPPSGYPVEIAWTYRPDSLSVASPGDGTQTTAISTYYADLLFFACMVGVAGHQKNYGAGVSDPQQAMSWEGRYQQHLGPAQLEEGRRRSQAYADQSKVEPPEAVPVR